MNTTNDGLKATYKLPGNRGYFVYHLMRDGLVVYVGQSTSLLQRLMRHAITKEFDSVHVYEYTTPEKMIQKEKIDIAIFQPQYNRRGTMKSKNYWERPDFLLNDDKQDEKVNK
jgi:DNA-binding sugar fermentation-stimulating protein